MSQNLQDQKKADHKAVRAEIAQRRRKHDEFLAQEAARRGVALGFTPSHTYEKNSSNAGLWPMQLTDLLIAHPERARDSNEVLLAEVSKAMALRKPLKKEQMSRPISTKQAAAVNAKLSRAGYAADIKTMTEAKRSVRSGKANKYTGTEESPSMQGNSTITFLVDGIIVNGEQYQLIAARRVATGNPLRDLTVRMHDTRIPLSVVVASAGVTEAQALRGIAAAAVIAERREAERAAATVTIAQRMADQVELDAIEL